MPVRITFITYSAMARQMKPGNSSTNLRYTIKITNLIKTFPIFQFRPKPSPEVARCLRYFPGYAL